MTMKWQARITCSLILVSFMFILLMWWRKSSSVWHVLRVTEKEVKSNKEIHLSTSFKNFIQNDFRNNFSKEEVKVNMKNIHFYGSSNITEECNKFHLKNKIRSHKHQHQQNVACKRMKPVVGSCKISKTLFQYSPRPCPRKDISDICSVQVKNSEYEVHCDSKNCAERHSIYIGVVSEDNGILEWTALENALLLEKHILEILYLKNSQKHYGFCVVKCLAAKYVSDFDAEILERIPSEYLIVQILLLPVCPNRTRPKLDLSGGYAMGSSKKMSHSHPPNINIIMLDSVSRSHFYRSLPTTVKTLDQLNHIYFKSKNSTFVLDFELIQGIKSRTFESLQALFTGYVNVHEKPFATLAMPPTDLGTHVLLKSFKGQGYETLWLEDLCWQWEWGLSKNFRVYNKSDSYLNMWKNMKKALQRAGIDNIDLTLSSCEIFNNLDINDHFQGPDTVCYGSKFQHEIHFDYLEKYQKAKSEKQEPFFTFMSNSVGHEPSGLRLQTSDKHLAKYLQFLKHLPNTITIIFSDHGNSYGDFIHNSFEGRLETYHPFMFMILPVEIQNYLGEEKLASLILNQDRLISWLDLHYLLRTVGQVAGGDERIRKQFSVNPDGLLSPVKPERTCSDMPRIAPNFCICEQYENPAMNDSVYAMYGHFALAKMNEGIHKYLVKSSGAFSIYGNCQRLVMHRFRNVFYSFIQGDKVAVKMDIVTKTWNNALWRELFTVEVILPYSEFGQLELRKYDRISQYGNFSKCVDDGVPLSLCICSGKNAKVLKLETSRKDATLATSKIEHIREDIDCLFIMSTFNTHGFVLEVFNLCTDKKSLFKVTVEGTFSNLALSENLNVYVRSGESRLLLAAVQKDTGHQPKWSYKVFAHA